jgi:hypothetical protein
MYHILIFVFLCWLVPAQAMNQLYQIITLKTEAGDYQFPLPNALRIPFIKQNASAYESFNVTIQLKHTDASPVTLALIDNMVTKAHLIKGAMEKYSQGMLVTQLAQDFEDTLAPQQAVSVLRLAFFLGLEESICPAVARLIATFLHDQKTLVLNLALYPTHDKKSHEHGYLAQEINKQYTLMYKELHPELGIELSVKDLQAYNQTIEPLTNEPCDHELYHPVYTLQNLSNHFLTSVDGIETIPHITEVHSINFSKNLLTSFKGLLSYKRRYPPIPGIDPSIDSCFFNQATNFGDTLQKLDLSHNHLVRLSEEITKLKNLRILDVSHNALTTIPDNIKKLYYLVQLKANNNHLQTLPPLSPTIHTLDISHNQFQKLPTTLKNLSWLRILQASNNQLTELPTILGRLSRIQKLYLENNNISLQQGLLDILTKLRYKYSSSPATMAPDNNTSDGGLLYLNLTNNQLSSEEIKDIHQLLGDRTEVLPLQSPVEPVEKVVHKQAMAETQSHHPKFSVKRRLF